MEVRTLPEILHRAVEVHGKPDALRHRRDGGYVDLSAHEVRRRAEDLAFGLLALGLSPGDRVGLLAENRPGWVVADMAILTAGALTVPVYPTLPAEQVAFILGDCGARICFVSTRAQLEKVLSASATTSLERLITMDSLHHEHPSVLTIEQVTRLGARARAESPGLLRTRLETIDPAGVATILYTSGTTGRPKGVMLSHENILSNLRAALAAFEIGPSDTCLSFLPLSHIFERMAGYYTMLYAGATIAYAESIESVAANMLEVRPTIMISVPRLYEKIYARALDAALAGSPVKKRLFFWAKRVGERVVDRRLAGAAVGTRLAFGQAIASRLVFSKLRARSGGQLRFFVSGGAPLSPTITRFFWAADLPILEGYGLTETSPVISANTLQATRLGTVGRPVAGVQVRIGEDGEILCKGPNVMLGYYRMPEETAAAIQDGWLRTGDIGHLDEEGFLVITDRKKDLLKTSGGKYIAPQPIENRLKLNKFVSQAVVVGNRRKHAAAIIVPNFENLRPHAERSAIPASSDAELVAHPRVRELYQEVLDEVNRDLSSFETIKRFELLTEDFTIESGELTPSLKVKRNVIEQRYRDTINAMYGERLQV